jgi:hypothetical protein
MVRSISPTQVHLFNQYNYMASACILSPHVAPDLPGNVVVLCTGEGFFFAWDNGSVVHVEKGICTWQSGLWPQDMGLDGLVCLALFSS